MAANGLVSEATGIEDDDVSIIEVEVETLDGPLGADPRELLEDAAVHAAMEPGYAARFEDAYGLNWRGRVAFRAAAWGAARARRWPRWDGEAVLTEARRLASGVA